MGVESVKGGKAGKFGKACFYRPFFLPSHLVQHGAGGWGGERQACHVLNRQGGGTRYKQEVFGARHAGQYVGVLLGRAGRGKQVRCVGGAAEKVFSQEGAG